jgi:hypothetical protein
MNILASSSVTLSVSALSLFLAIKFYGLVLPVSG